MGQIIDPNEGFERTSSGIILPEKPVIHTPETGLPAEFLTEVPEEFKDVNVPLIGTTAQDLILQ